MTLARMLEIINQSTSGRLVRLSQRLAGPEGLYFRPRDAVRLVWLMVIADVLNDRIKYHITDN